MTPKEDSMLRLMIGMIAESGCDVASAHDQRTLGDVMSASVIPENWHPPSPAAACVAVSLFVGKWLGNCWWMSDASVASVMTTLQVFMRDARERKRSALEMGFTSEARCYAEDIRASNAALVGLTAYPEVWPIVSRAILTSRSEDKAGSSQDAAQPCDFTGSVHGEMTIRWPEWRNLPLQVQQKTRRERGVGR